MEFSVRSSTNANQHGTLVRLKPPASLQLSSTTAPSFQSSEQVNVLTDNKPWVQAYQKLCRDKFFTSSRVWTFLTAVSRFHISVRHLKGDADLPSDFSCRNATPCQQF